MEGGPVLLRIDGGRANWGVFIHPTAQSVCAGLAPLPVRPAFRFQATVVVAVVAAVLARRRDASKVSNSSA